MYFHTIYLLLISSIILSVSFQLQSNSSVKLCVIQSKLHECELLENFARENGITLDCVPARDRIECLHKIENGEANVVNVPSNEAYAASTHFQNWIPLLEEKTTTEEFMYESVAVVKKNSQISSLNDLKGKKSCHTGYKRTAGWSIPITLLIAQGVMPCSFGEELRNVKEFFSASCVPGNWSKNIDEDQILKSAYPNLCELCSEGCNSSASDKYAGYEGALKCLIEKSADIAFTKFSVVTNFSSQNPNFTDNYRLLCVNGTLNPVNSLCYWGARANPLIISKKDLAEADRASIQVQLIKLAEQRPRPYFLQGTLLWNYKSEVLRNISGSIKDHLNKANFSVTMDKPLPHPCLEKYNRLCITSKIENDKCKDFKAAAFASQLRPHIECVLAKNCIERIQNEAADFIVGGLKASYDALRQNEMSSVLSETFSTANFSYYLVAVIKKNSSITSINDLKGKKSCHSNFNCAASWTLPKGTLATKKLLKGSSCELDEQMASFFSSSCVPEAPSTLPSLCSLCKGDKQNKTKCSRSDEYEGFNGAFRCLALGGGDVAFIPHSIIIQLTDDVNSKESWSKDLKSNDFKLLCIDNQIKSVGEYESCNWGKIPGKQILLSKKKSQSDRRSLQLMMIQSDFTFSKLSSTFQLYSEYENQTNVIFSNNTSGLVPNQDDRPAKDVLGEYVYNMLDAAYCAEAGANTCLHMSVISMCIICFIHSFLW